ncbi:hypothetical protein MHB50_12010 [Siminovitchia sp. FSL H7-0308]|uniref:Uncharacterized protein n=1 Tax=Siminovitchia thermophila TaxID=1245522 RepID=A0ABS2R619_9BACI|nr:hypothetical protein [Siminovitchia thermophila]MBM7715106.1 hypothetical protein [Siminovitchia thermophila]ONK22813.1 hypothetical protein BLX87_13930 [Bacillus sp. VT-16-64]
MQTNQSAGRIFIDEWVMERLVMGKSIEDMNGTTFIYGNELLTLKKKADGSFVVVPQKAPEVVVLEKPHTEVEICPKCGTEYSSFKESLQCCADID